MTRRAASHGHASLVGTVKIAVCQKILSKTLQQEDLRGHRGTADDSNFDFFGKRSGANRGAALAKQEMVTMHCCLPPCSAHSRSRQRHAPAYRIAPPGRSTTMFDRRMEATDSASFPGKSRWPRREARSNATPRAGQPLCLTGGPSCCLCANGNYKAGWSVQSKHRSNRWSNRQPPVKQLVKPCFRAAAPAACAPPRLPPRATRPGRPWSGGGPGRAPATPATRARRRLGVRSGCLGCVRRGICRGAGSGKIWRRMSGIGRRLPSSVFVVHRLRNVGWCHSG